MSTPSPDPSVRPRRCVVTGAGGFIGSHLVDRMLDAGHMVVGIDCFTDYYPRWIKERNITAALGNPRFTLVEADLRTAEVGPLVDGADAVFHLAAMAGLLRSWTAFDDYVGCNVLATQRLLEAVRGASAGHLIHVSTSSVYGLDSSGDEERPTRPISPYGVTKLAAEHLVLAYARVHDLPFTILRYFSIYGPRQRPEMGYAVFIERVLRGEPITIHGDGNQTRGNTFIDDCVAATLAAMAHGPAGTVINIGGGEVISALGALRLIEAITGRQAQIVFGPPRPGEQQQALADTNRAQAVLGWSPQVGIEAGLRAQVAWQQAMLATA